MSEPAGFVHVSERDWMWPEFEIHVAGDMDETVHDVATLYEEVLVREANTNLAIKCHFSCE
ncbi:hypothetical protein CFP56_014576 [Quercus suber]|uniref:Uncharacterized protein n=1 Tax=Quercus suber TaxID=58331 RepID=A0AAW0M236_QUESU